MTLRLKKKKWLINLIIPLMLAGCHVMLFGAYDQVTDEGIQKIQTQVITVVSTLERNFDNNDTAANNYQKFLSFYNEINGEVQSLKTRCSTLPEYGIIISQLDALGDNISLFEKNHKLGFTGKEELDPYKNGFESEFKAIIQLQNGLKRKKTG